MRSSMKSCAAWQHARNETGHPCAGPNHRSRLCIDLERMRVNSYGTVDVG